MAEFDAETVDALNTLLEDERASVEMEVALASGASEYAERETLVAMGADDIGFCVALHEQLDRAGAPVTRRINGVVFQALGAERYDDRLLVFARHQLLVNERYRDLTTRDLDNETHDLLQTITTTHDRQIDWLERRAQAFAATRQFDFRGGNVGAPGGGSGTAAPASDVEPAPRDDPPAPSDDGSGSARDELDGATPDGSLRPLRSAIRGGAPGRREPHALYTPGAPSHDAADGRNGAPYTMPSQDDPADDEYTAPPNAPYPSATDGTAGFDAAPSPATLPTTPNVRRRYGAYRPGAANPPYNIPPLAAGSEAPDDAPAQPYTPNTPYTYADSAYRYATPNAPTAPNSPSAPDRSGYTPYGPYPDERDGDD